MSLEGRWSPPSVADRWRWLWDRVSPARSRVRSRFEVDTRALAALRVALGLIVLADLFHRAGSLELFYTDDGAYPIAAYEATYSRFTGLSLHAASGDLWFQQLLFVIAGLFAVALILGYRTRSVAAVSFVLLVSLHARNPAVLNGADRLLRVVFFVALLTPLGERWSIDALRRGSARQTVVGFGTVALLVQPLVVFSQNAVAKRDGETWYSGEAVEIALANDAMTIHIGNYLHEYATLLEAANWIWVGLLSGSVAFLLLTDGRLRALFALVYVGAFAGMAASMSVGLFPFVLTASVLPFLTTPFWTAIGRLLPASLTDRRLCASRLGPLGRPSVERRLLESLRARGYESAASFAVAYGRSLLTVVALLALVWMLLFGVAHVSDHDVPDGIDSPHLDEQQWGLYAPDPGESYSWYAVEAELANESTVDAFDGGEIVEDRPPDAAAEYDSFRHRKFMQEVRDAGRGDSNGIIAERYADDACDRAADVHDKRVETVTVYRFIQPSPLEGTYEEPSQLTVIDWDCVRSESLDE